MGGHMEDFPVGGDETVPSLAIYDFQTHMYFVLDICPMQIDY